MHKFAVVLTTSLFLFSGAALAVCRGDGDCGKGNFCRIEQTVNTRQGPVSLGQCAPERFRIPGTNETVYDRHPYADEWMLGKSRAEIDAELARRGMTLETRR